jgi:hypothetical protein
MGSSNAWPSSAKRRSPPSKLVYPDREQLLLLLQLTTNLVHNTIVHNLPGLCGEAKGVGTATYSTIPL